MEVCTKQWVFVVAVEISVVKGSEFFKFLVRAGSYRLANRSDVYVHLNHIVFKWRIATNIMVGSVGNLHV